MPALDGSRWLRYLLGMNDKRQAPPKPRDEGRKERLKQALKANLARRKEQSKARTRDEA